MADTAKTTKPEAADKSAAKPVCGIIMPIAGDGEYTAEHWRRVQRIIERSIIKAEMTVRLVWERPEVDVIHARILQGIYESDVVICDVSGLNPNVMLELGLRLSTRRPTIVITDSEKKPPFDIGVFQYHSYQRDLEYNSVDGFIDEISKKLRQVSEAYEQKRYKSFVENFTFEVVEPTEVTVTTEFAITERLDSFARQLSRMEGRIAGWRGQNSVASAEDFSIKINAQFVTNRDEADAIATLLAANEDVKGVSYVEPTSSGTVFTVRGGSGLSMSRRSALRQWVAKTVDDIDVPF